jgi:lysylphosphatidylglycerol synthetase-like protein (DUF2156 family)
MFEPFVLSLSKHTSLSTVKVGCILCTISHFNYVVRHRFIWQQELDGACGIRELVAVISRITLHFIRATIFNLINAEISSPHPTQLPQQKQRHYATYQHTSQ